MRSDTHGTDELLEAICDAYDNGIYPPKNLIITMDDGDKPLDIMAIRRIIQNMILPFC